VKECHKQRHNLGGVFVLFLQISVYKTYMAEGPINTQGNKKKRKSKYEMKREEREA